MACCVRMVSPGYYDDDYYGEYREQRCDKYHDQVKQRLQACGAWYDPEPTDNAPLDKALVMTPFWNHVATQSAEEKSKTFEKVFNHYLHNIKRYQLAAAAYAGLDPKLMASALWEHFVLYRDESLVKLMLEHGVSANSREFGDSDNYIIFRAETVAMAKLLKDAGADLNVKNSRNHNLLHNIFIQNRSLELIDFFIANDVNPYEEDCSGESALVQGINYHIVESQAKKNVKKRIKAFLDAGVPPEKIQEAFDSRKAKKKSCKANKKYLPVFLKAAEEYRKQERAMHRLISNNRFFISAPELIGQ